MKKMRPINKKISLCHLPEKEIIIWHSNNMYVWAQLAYWDDVKRVRQFVPVRSPGFVAITSTNVDAGCIPPECGYLIFRPCALELEYSSSVRVELKPIDVGRMREWYGTFSPWKHICLPTR